MTDPVDFSAGRRQILFEWEQMFMTGAHHYAALAKTKKTKQEIVACLSIANACHSVAMDFFLMNDYAR